MITSREEALKKLINVGKSLGFGGLVWGIAAEGVAHAEVALRPPGAFPEEKDFARACIKCGTCVDVCPYDTLQLGRPWDGRIPGAPYYKPRSIPCYMCENIPCANKCPSGALNVKRLVSGREGKTGEVSINNARMGIAVIHKETCLAYWGIQCDACYRACPLIDKALVLKKERNIVTGKHANLLPVVNGEHCTGCGLCEHVCVVEKAAIFVLPLSIATGKVSDHYIRRGEKEDEKRMETKIEERSESKDVKSGLKYLNNDDEFK